MSLIPFLSFSLSTFSLSFSLFTLYSLSLSLSLSLSQAFAANQAAVESLVRTQPAKQTPNHHVIALHRNPKGTHMHNYYTNITICHCVFNVSVTNTLHIIMSSVLCCTFPGVCLYTHCVLYYSCIVYSGGLALPAETKAVSC